MKFWDTSAIGPLFFDEESSPAVTALWQADRKLAIWLLTDVELCSALQRRVRAGQVSARDASQVVTSIDRTLATAVVVTDHAQARAHARGLLIKHAPTSEGAGPAV